MLSYCFKIKGLLLVIFIILSASHNQSANSQEVDFDKLKGILNAVSHSAFNGQKDQPLQKWDQPIKVYVFGNTGAYKKNLAVSPFITISNNTSVMIEQSAIPNAFWVVDSNPGHYIRENLFDRFAEVYSPNQINQLIEMSETQKCLGVNAKDEAGNVFFSAALISSKISDDNLVQCSNELLIKALGLKYYIPYEIDSVLAEASNRKEYSVADIDMVRAVYFEPVKSGMKYNEFLKAITPIIGQDVMDKVLSNQ